MSKPKVRPLPRDYTGHWNHARFLLACVRAGVPVGERGAAQVLADLMTTHRARRGDPTPVSRYVASRWLSGERDPSYGAVGRQPAIHELALVLDVDIGWLMTGKVNP